MIIENIYFQYLILLLTGILAGFINTLAGGGSTLTLPVLIICGLPSPVANATNRVAILMQNIIGTAQFKKHNQLTIKPIIHITISSVIGAIIGSLIAVKLNSYVFDKFLGIILLFILVMILLPKPVKKNNKRKVPKLIESIIFFGIGLYGGFIQAGVGFLFIGALNLISDLNLIKTNAVKLFIIGCYTFFAVIIFALSGKILWTYGLALAIGNMTGAYFGVKIVIKNGETIIKVILAFAIIIAIFKLFGLF